MSSNLWVNVNEINEMLVFEEAYLQTDADRRQGSPFIFLLANIGKISHS